MTLDEAIAHAEDMANKQNKIAFELNTTYNAVTEYSKECSKCAEDHRQLAEWLKDYKRLKEREPCEDAVSRQAVLDINESHHGQMPNRINHQIWQEIKDLPSVKPQEIRTGHWITDDIFDGDVAYRCSECDELFWLESGTPKDNEYYFCPKCGANMSEILTGSELQESEDTR